MCFLHTLGTVEKKREIRKEEMKRCKKGRKRTEGKKEGKGGEKGRKVRRRKPFLDKYKILY